MVIGIRVEAQNVKKGTIKHTNSCYFTMVAKGDDEKPTAVPKLVLENREHVKRFIEAMKMKEIKSKVKEEMDDARSNIHLENALDLLKDERCVIKF
jgi:acyl-CoA hydrolase